MIQSGDYSCFQKSLAGNLINWIEQRQSSQVLMNHLKMQYICTAQAVRANLSEEELPLPYDWESKLAEILSTSDNKQVLCNMLCEFFKELFIKCRNEERHTGIVHDVKIYIDSHYAERISNQTLGKEFGFVPSYISRLFKVAYGISPVDYLTNVRIKAACSLISSQPDINFSTLANDIGFTDSSYFSRIFKKIVGQTPSEYKQAVSEQIN